MELEVKNLSILICMVGILGLIGLAYLISIRNIKQGREFNFGALAIPVGGLLSLLVMLTFFF